MNKKEKGLTMKDVNDYIKRNAKFISSDDYKAIGGKLEKMGKGLNSYNKTFHIKGEKYGPFELKERKQEGGDTEYYKHFYYAPFDPKNQKDVR